MNRQAISRRAQMRGSLLDDQVAMADLAAADAQLRGAHAGLLASADECWARAEAGQPIDRALQARAFLAAQHCSDVAVDVCATAHRSGGGAAAYRTSPLLRALPRRRDRPTAPDVQPRPAPPPRPHPGRQRRGPPAFRHLTGGGKSRPY